VAGLSVRLDGGRQLRAGLAGVEDGIKDLKAAHLEAAQIAAKASARLAPVVSGNLQRTIRAAGTARAGIIRAGSKRAPYAAPIHWGWGRRNIKGAFYLSDGAQNSEGRWIRVYQDHLDQLINKIEGT
jgi:hypothetical protein